MVGTSKPLIPYKVLIDNLKLTAANQWHLGAMLCMFVTAGGLVIGAAYNNMRKPEVGLTNASRSKYGQWNMVPHEKPSMVLFATKKMASAYHNDPHLAALHAEIYENGRFDL